MTNSQAFIGRVLQANATGFLVGCSVPQLQQSGLAFGALVRVAPAQEGDTAPEIFGIIAGITLPGDDLVKQLTITPDLPASIHADQHQRNLPVEIQVLSLGYREGGGIRHLLPPRPPLTLANLYLCTPAEVCEFTTVGRLGYFRHILRAQDFPMDELLAVHLRQAQEAHRTCQGGDAEWVSRATRHLITLLRDDYDHLTRLLDALGEVVS